LEQPQAQDPSSKLKDVIVAARPHVSNGEFQELEELLAKYEDIFAVDTGDYGRTNKVYHCMDMEDVRPICQPPRRLTLAKQAKVSEMLDMQCRGVIEESDISWLSLAILVRKKNGKLRFCMDYRKLNDVTKTISHCPGLMILWTNWPEPNGSQLSI
jgi:hypothetical protein